jgi:hypothetical protein
MRCRRLGGAKAFMRYGLTTYFGNTRLAFELKNTYAQLNAFDWSN